MDTVTIDKGIAYLIDVSISTLHQWEKPKWSYWGWWAFIPELMDEGIAYLMSAYPCCASEKRFFNEAVLGRDSFKLTGGITRLMSAYPRRACSPDVSISTLCQREKQSCCWGWLTLIQSMRELCTWYISAYPHRASEKNCCKKVATVIDEAVEDVHQEDLIFCWFAYLSVHPPLSCIPALQTSGICMSANNHEQAGCWEQLVSHYSLSFP